MNKHAKQYAKDWSENDRPWELWECTHISSGGILPLIDHPKWEAHCNYRRKKQTGEKQRQAQMIACSAVDLSEMLRSNAIEKSKYFDIAELHMKVLVGNILKGLNKNG